MVCRQRFFFKKNHLTQKNEALNSASLASGRGRATVLTCDLTPEYVRFNAEEIRELYDSEDYPLPRHQSS